MNFLRFCVIILFCLIFIIETESSSKIDQTCFPNDLFNSYSQIIKDTFVNFSSSNEANVIRNRLERANLTTQCFVLNSTHGKSSNAISDLFMSLTNTVVIPYCLKSTDQSGTGSEIPDSSKRSTVKIWIYGFASVTIINFCAGLGILFIPVMKKKSYKIVMSFMIALAVGSLSGSALLILIPDAMQLGELQAAVPGSHINYKYRATVVFGGIYMFFLLERFLKWIINKNVKKYSEKKTLIHGSMNVSRPHKHRLDVEDLSTERPSVALPEHNDCLNNHSKELIDEHFDQNESSLIDPIVVPSRDHKKKVIAPVAWMIIFGDALHNFIDGLSIGAAFSRNVMTGVSLSIACLCEELPHELGDFAILLNAGMTVKQALMWNMLSAATCYFGFIIGVILGELTTGSIWVFAIAGGMFLYISLVDMMPEMNEMLENEDLEEIRSFGILNTFIIQNIGLLIGYGLLFLMALFGDRIQIS